LQSRHRGNLRGTLLGEALGFDEEDAMLVDPMITVAESEALASWVAPHKLTSERRIK
jgi:hypothetical protein